MGLKDWWRSRRRAPLVDAPPATRRLAAHRVSTSVAEDMVVVELDADAAAGLTAALRHSPEPVTVSAGGRPVTFLPARDARQAPALDPDAGWLIPLTEQTRTALVDTVAGPGAWEIPGINLGVVVEAQQ